MACSRDANHALRRSSPRPITSDLFPRQEQSPMHCPSYEQSQVTCQCCSHQLRIVCPPAPLHLDPTSHCRKGKKKKVLPDGVKLINESLLRQTQLRSLSKSDTKLHELNRVKLQKDSHRPVSMDFLCTSGASGEGESSMNSSSISISVLLRRELPRIPLPPSSAETPSPDQTYSNLVFSAARRPAPETLYEPVVAKQGAPQLVPNLASSTEAASLGSEGRVVTADYACVRKVKKPQPEPCEVTPGESSQKPSDGLPGWGGAACSPPTAKVEEMYSTVCKAGKKKAQDSPSAGRAAADVGPGDHSWPAACQEEGVRAGYPSTLACPLLIEPCYESVDERPWAKRGSSSAPDPDYAEVDAKWKKSERKSRSPRSCPSENFYESVSDLWEGEARRTTTTKVHNGLEVFITDL
ncbi:PREDICTED: lck-interacting transmembrane adapter 1 isoform X1 [Gavialis gangeticus]|uniref:lck-interacting transmembrane adapter 1 isoform X1 n=1 Tax=Gavialis gangeticus TaxID=94835 RepID=UPI00092FC76D|nr:PREDICTED: lck-interacting transmembrane adapter 1 isoform X1 [Gavialis gangeticus]